MSELVSGTARHRRFLWVTFSLTLTYFFVEVVGGILTNSLALLADAAHMLTDVVGLGLALFAAWLSAKAATAARTYGYYRAEILAALTNAVLLVLVSFYILYEAYRRFQEPPEVSSGPMLAVATVGLIVNVIGIVLLRRGAQESLNVQGAFLEVISDLLSSVGVIVAGGIMWLTGWYYADPLFSVVIGLFILPRTWHLLTQAVNILLEATPSRINLAEVERAILTLDGVASIHDLHVWTITSGIDAVSAHVVLAEGVPAESASDVLAKVIVILKDKFNLEHSTIQIEQATSLDGQTKCGFEANMRI